MQDKIEKGDRISKFLFGAFMMVSIARISVGLYEWHKKGHKKEQKKEGCPCQNKK